MASPSMSNRGRSYHPIITVTSPVSTGGRSSARKRVQMSAPQDEMEDYDWLNLPPIRQIKNAIARQRVSQGINYILPINKTKSSVENVYQTNLRVMFQEPFLHDDPRKYDDAKVGRYMKYHFVPNRISQSIGPKSQESSEEILLNADSEIARKNYHQTMPSNRKKTSESLKQRSGLFLPIKTKIPPEAERLKKEAEQILQSVQTEQEDNNQEDLEEGNATTSQQRKSIPQAEMMSQIAESAQMRRHPRRLSHRLSFSGATPQEKELSQEKGMFKKASMFSSYEALKMTKLPEKYELPEELLSPYLSETKASDIWQWLHHGEKPNEFTHFLNVCS